jgi:RNA polymerase sigma-70 factor (ECF subfamily)
VTADSSMTEVRPLVLPREADLRLANAARENFQFIWRSLRRFGVRPEAAVDDAAQRVFEIAVRKQAEIEVGRERAFFFKTALNVALEARRHARRDSIRFADDALDALADPTPDPEGAAQRNRLRRALDALLSAMPIELSTVFVLFELEQLSSVEIARMLELPVGTVSSRLRRAREEFRQRAARLRASWERAGGVR